MAPTVSLFGPIDTLLAPVIEYVLLGLLLVNMVGRVVEYNQIKDQAEDGDEAIGRHPVRVATSVLLVVGAFYYMTLHHHAGLIFSTLVVGLFITDIFEIESRKVEARQGLPIDRPNAAIAASVLALLYIGFHTVFFVIKPIWDLII